MEFNARPRALVLCTLLFEQKKSEILMEVFGGSLTNIFDLCRSLKQIVAFDIINFTRHLYDMYFERSSIFSFLPLFLSLGTKPH